MTPVMRTLSRPLNESPSDVRSKWNTRERRERVLEREDADREISDDLSRSPVANHSVHCTVLVQTVREQEFPNDTGFSLLSSTKCLHLRR